LAQLQTAGHAAETYEGGFTIADGEQSAPFPLYWVEVRGCQDITECPVVGARSPSCDLPSHQAGTCSAGRLMPGPCILTLPRRLRKARQRLTETSSSRAIFWPKARERDDRAPFRSSQAAIRNERPGSAIAEARDRQTQSKQSRVIRQLPGWITCPRWPSSLCVHYSGCSPNMSDAHPSGRSGYSGSTMRPGGSPMICHRITPVWRFNWAIATSRTSSAISPAVTGRSPSEFARSARAHDGNQVADTRW